MESLKPIDRHAHSGVQLIHTESFPSLAVDASDSQATCV